MEVTVREKRGANIVEVHGKLVGDAANCLRFHDLYQSLLDKGRKKFVLDLQDTPWANSLGIGMIIAAYASVRNRGGEMVLAGATDRLRDVLEVTHLFTVFKVFDTVDAAIDHLIPRKEGGQPTARA
jgi:anti-anti-sigma factor